MQKSVAGFYVAAIQMISGEHLQANLNQAAMLIRQAVEKGANLVALPEYFCLMGAQPQHKLSIQEGFGEGVIQQFLSDQARQHQIYIVGGSLPLITPEATRISNSLLVYGPNGQCLSRYDKIHLFRYQTAHEQYDESEVIQAGDAIPTTVHVGSFNMGLALCYDLRFPELFRAMGPIDLLVIPSAFTYTTGKAHWEVLLRARAIENQCYVLAPAQGGRHENGRTTWGHSLLVSPWGEVIDCLPEGEGVVMGELNPQLIMHVREILPALSHRVM